MFNKSFKLKCTSLIYKTVDNTCYAYCTFECFLGKVRSTGIAVCSKKDEFDKLQGRRIARARAELNAYAAYRFRLLKFIDFIYDEFTNSLYDTLDNITGYIDHQKDYIRTLI